MIALIPARGASKRCPKKNIRPLCGHPLLAYTIGAAQDAGFFQRIAVSTDDPATAHLADDYGVEVILRPPDLATDVSPDIGWLRHALDVIGFEPLQTWAILRPTSPFRTAATIRRAARVFYAPDNTHDSVRAVEPVSQHPGKMWEIPHEGSPLRPLLQGKHADGTPWHSSPTQSLPRYYVQNACIDMGWTANLTTHGTIHGKKIAPFFTEGHEGFDINTERDFREAEYLAASGQAVLPSPAVAAGAADLWAV